MIRISGADDCGAPSVFLSALLRRQTVDCRLPPSWMMPIRDRPTTGDAVRQARQPVASPTLEIANAMVRAYKDALGRGPTKSHVHFARADTLVVLLQDTMTVQERNLASLGKEEPLREDRFVLTRAFEDRFRSIVERALERRTLACISGFDSVRDIAVEVFTLAPEAADGQRATS